MDNVDDLADVLVRFRNFLHERPAHRAAPRSSLIFRVAHYGPAAGCLFCLCAAQQAPSAMTTAGEGFGAALLGANEHIGIAAHIARDQHRLPEVPIDLWNLGMAGWQRARGAFTMYAQAAGLAVHHVCLELTNV